MRAAAGASPLGDVNARHRAGLAWSLGEEVDQFEAALAVLGKARAFRALGRASDLAMAALAMAGLVLAQIGAALAAVGKLALRRALAPPRVVAKRRASAP